MSRPIFVFVVLYCLSLGLLHQMACHTPIARAVATGDDLQALQQVPLDIDEVSPSGQVRKRQLSTGKALVPQPINETSTGASASSSAPTSTASHQGKPHSGTSSGHSSSSPSVSKDVFPPSPPAPTVAGSGGTSSGTVNVFSEAYSVASVVNSKGSAAASVLTSAIDTIGSEVASFSYALTKSAGTASVNAATRGVYGGVLSPRQGAGAGMDGTTGASIWHVSIAAFIIGAMGMGALL
ncbi:unnamed protein product [Parajaminaea phylloscopi]